MRFAVKILVVEFSDVEAKITIECKRNPETIFEIIMTNDKARHYIFVGFPPNNFMKNELQFLTNSFSNQIAFTHKNNLLPIVVTPNQCP